MSDLVLNNVLFNNKYHLEGFLLFLLFFNEIGSLLIHLHLGSKISNTIHHWSRKMSLNIINGTLNK